MKLRKELSGRVSAKTTELTLKIQGGQIRIMIFVFVCFLVRLSPVRCTSTRTFTRKNNPNQTTNSIINALLIMNNKKKDNL